MLNTVSVASRASAALARSATDTHQINEINKATSGNKDFDFFMLTNPVKDLQKTERFYHNMLGFKTLSLRDDELFMSLGDYQFRFLKDITAAEKFDSVFSEEISSRVDHWAFRSVDLLAREDFLKSENIPYKKIQVPNTKNYQIFIHDPDHHSIELIFKASDQPGHRENNNAAKRIEDALVRGDAAAGSAHYGVKMRGGKMGGVEMGGDSAPEHAATMGVIGFDHASRLTKRLDSDAALFQNVLHLKAIERPPFDVRGAWFTNGEVEFHLVSGEELDELPNSGTDKWGFIINTKATETNAATSPYALKHSSISDVIARKSSMEMDVLVTPNSHYPRMMLLNA